MIERTGRLNFLAKVLSLSRMAEGNKVIAFLKNSKKNL